MRGATIRVPPGIYEGWQIYAYQYRKLEKKAIQALYCFA